MKNLNRANAGYTQKLPIKVIQYGEGNFLRAFVDYIINKLNAEAGFDAGVAVIQPLPDGLIDILNEQDGLYNLFLRGIKNGTETEEIHTISCVQQGLNPYADYKAYLALAEEKELQFLISNTTEAGISFDENDTLDGTPHNSFPAKVTALLYRRFEHFAGSNDKGLTIIPCELINHNADTLKKIILQYADLWDLGGAFKSWIETANSFHNTLVDRIVPGYPKDDIDTYQSQLAFKDKLIVSAETFLLWVIEGDEQLKAKIPFDQIDENVVVVKDMQPYRTRKVRILNGAHTTMVPFSILFGTGTVKETVDHEFTGSFVRDAVFKEINPTLDLSEEELTQFANAVFDRFRNPFIKHQLSSIALNTVSKFKVRVLPSLLAYQTKYNRLPEHLTFALACLIRFYKGVWQGRKLPIQDDAAVVAFFDEVWKTNDPNKIAQRILSENAFWDQDLNNVERLTSEITRALELIEKQGIKDGFIQFAARYSKA
ncbi:MULTISPECIES: tagaturonate reductase [unclassified Leeuwenhoekiella]|uniref:tagaturonate reductase n=1 Tax=unclassified Leeuwenhoekiella TaxID=2615029 RepID=UPI000C642DDF|nr:MULTISPECIES: tagaturonate reductase [unclassified Leeuwenhoekiella]MAW93632.1 altronate oxidoreductase [Leeuwenhoekiella sp.]MBA80375.1 altronate oxidoreductase [Leeuwenhoekiella sp.]|tara:strand:+ start:1094 stop:2548 length:1455 start_codon:yes stop_codon:yes gene_type:complete